jgi:hypothetical protein
MNQFALTNPLKNHRPICGDLVTMAERELAAFFNAVTELFGSEQAEISAEDWLQEMTAHSDLPASTRQWRLLTVRVMARLASRMNASSMSITSRTLAYSD